MEKTKVIGVRFREPLLTKIERHEMKNSQLIRTAMQRYFLDDGKNNILCDDFETKDNIYTTKSNNGYTQEFISSLKLQIQDLKNDKDYLQQQNNALMLLSIPLLSRIKVKLLSNEKRG